jgi:hypothetical protein
MTKLPDEAERLRALTELASTLLVEAAAGTGKTSLLAGRKASGSPPWRASITRLAPLRFAKSWDSSRPRSSASSRPSLMS